MNREILDIFSQFHFVRPLWLLAVAPALLLVVALWKQHAQRSLWNRAVDSELLPHLLDSRLGRQQSRPLSVLLLAWIVASFSMAGPVWEKLPQPVQKKEDALVIIQDLSLSFYAQDLSPNRLTRARHKLTDILTKRKEGTTALVVYSGSAHIVAPLTDDTRTISSMVTALSPSIMPDYGSNPAEAVNVALDLFRETATSRGRILLLTDEVSEEDIDQVTELLGNRNFTLSVIGVGTEQGGPIPRNDGGFWKDDQGTIIVPSMDRTLLRRLAENNKGLYSDIQLTDADIDALLAVGPSIPSEDDFRAVAREFDQWKEQGAWLLLLILPIALLSFRRGWVFGVLLLMTVWSGDCHAMEWNDLWQRPDQQAAGVFNDDPEKAAALFQDPEWKGAALYRAGKFAEAAKSFQDEEDTDTLYNRGNSLAKMGSLEEAVGVYEKILQLKPGMEDAQFNKKLVEELLKQQQQQKQKGDGEQSDGEQSDEPQKGEKKEDNQQSSQQGEGEDQQQAGEQQQQSAGKSGEEQDKEQVEQQGRQSDDDKTAEQGEQKKEPGSEDQQENQQKGGEQQQVRKGDNAEQLNAEEQQAIEQWLRQVPDDPGGLLRRKFEYQSRQNRGRRGNESGKIW